MDFSEALKAVRMGNKIARFEWYGRIFFWALSGQRIMETRFKGKPPRPVTKLRSQDVLGTDWHIIT